MSWLLQCHNSVNSLSAISDTLCYGTTILCCATHSSSTLITVLPPALFTVKHHPALPCHRSLYYKSRLAGPVAGNGGCLLRVRRRRLRRRPFFVFPCGSGAAIPAARPPCYSATRRPSPDLLVKGRRKEERERGEELLIKI